MLLCCVCCVCWVCVVWGMRVCVGVRAWVCVVSCACAAASVASVSALMGILMTRISVIRMPNVSIPYVRVGDVGVCVWACARWCPPGAGSYVQRKIKDGTTSDNANAATS